MTELLSGADAQVEVDALLQRHGISGPAAVAYFSFASPQSCIAAREDDGSITPLIGFWPLPVRGDELLESIAAIDGNGAQLVANYARRFPALTERIRGFGSELEPVRTESLGWLMGACSLAIGMEEDDVAEALGALPALVHIDTVVVEHEGRYVLDSRQLLRSVMSFRIGDVPNPVLARSVFQSLGEYAATAVRRLLRDWKVDLAVCAGDLFERNQFIAERTRLGLVRPNLRVVFPEAA